MSVRVAFSMAAWLVACTPHEVDLGSNDTAPGVLPTDLEARCETPFVSAAPPVAVEDMTDMLVGTWARCPGDALAATPLQYPGLQFLNALESWSNGPWYGLRETAAGFVRDESAAAQGRFAVTPPVSVRLQFSNRSEATLVVVFDQSGQSLRVVRRFVDEVNVRYVRVP